LCLAAPASADLLRSQRSVALYDATDRRIGWVLHIEESGDAVVGVSVPGAGTFFIRASRDTLSGQDDSLYFTEPDCSGVTYIRAPHPFVPFATVFGGALISLNRASIWVPARGASPGPISPRSRLFEDFCETFPVIIDEFPAVPAVQADLLPRLVTPLKIK
jgi:hypothetical protein